MPKNIRKESCRYNYLFQSAIQICRLFWTRNWLRASKKDYANDSTATCLTHHGLAILQIHRLVRKNLILMISLFLIAVAVLIYMIYVLLYPEKF